MEIRKKKDNAATIAYLVRKLERVRQIGASPYGFEAQNIAHNAEHMPAPFARRNEKFHAIGEEKQTDLVAVLDRGERQHARDFRGELAFALRPGAKIAGRAHVHHEQ